MQDEADRTDKEMEAGVLAASAFMEQLRAAEYSPVQVLWALEHFLSSFLFTFIQLTAKADKQRLTAEVLDALTENSLHNIISLMNSQGID